VRRATLGLILSVAVLLPDDGAAQATWRPTPQPQVTAANAVWLYRGDPIFFEGTLYYPVGASVFFNGDVMGFAGTYEGVPVYMDATQTVYSVLYVPIGGKTMKPYERKRDGQVAGTVASRTPWFPVQVASEWFPIDEAPFGITGAPLVNLSQPAVTPCQPIVIPEAERPTCPTDVITPSIPPAAPSRPAQRPTTPTIFQVWVPFNGARWYSAGFAEPYAPDRFVKIGEHRGFPVYRDKRRTPNVIYIPSVEDGPVAPYRKR
jgi:hypothetical protein